MSAQIISLAEYQPHIVVPTPTAWHVYPEQYFRDFVSGSPVEEMPVDVMRAIVKDWLATFPVVPVGGNGNGA